MYSSSDSSIICFAKTTACSSSRNRFRSVPIFSPYSKTQTMSDSSLNSNCASSFSTVIDDAPGAGQDPEAMKGGVSPGLAETLEPPARANKMAPTIFQHSCQSCSWWELALINGHLCRFSKISSEIRTAGCCRGCHFFDLKLDRYLSYSFS